MHRVCVSADANLCVRSSSTNKKQKGGVAQALVGGARVPASVKPSDCCHFIRARRHRHCMPAPGGRGTLVWEFKIRQRAGATACGDWGVVWSMASVLFRMVGRV
jgi:hypothetical protein